LCSKSNVWASSGTVYIYCLSPLCMDQAFLFLFQVSKKILLFVYLFIYDNWTFNIM